MRHKVLFLLAVTSGSILPGFILAGGTALAATSTHKVCGNIPARSARCFATIVTDGGGISPLATGTPQGYGPADFKAAYANRGTSATHVGVVVAYDAPHIQADLATFSKVYGLPAPPVCTSARQTGCLEKVNQRGGIAYPQADSGWAVEASLDVESIHGQCPGCRISLVEASSPSMDNLAAATEEAVTLGAKVVSNSYGGAESSGEAAYDSHYHKPGAMMVVSSGDSGYGTEYPAASPYVVAVGGTSLKMSNGRVISETAWSGAGSGCSQFEYKPVWQHDKKCVMRSIADIAADADPTTGASIYDSYANSGRSGWFTVGGTSLAAPLVAGIIAASGNTSNEPASLYGGVGSVIRDITTGSNGNCATYLCKASPGYDGPTGLGVLSHL